MTTVSTPIIAERIDTKNRRVVTSFTYDSYRINISTSYNKQNKTIGSIASLVSYEQRDNGFVIEKSIGSIFSDNFAYRFVSPVLVNRYAEKTLLATHKDNVLQFKYEQLNKYEAKIHALLNGASSDEI